MYGPPRSWRGESPRRYGPPGRFPRRRSRSPIPPMGERYPFPEPPSGPPLRSPHGVPPYPRGPRGNEPVFSPRSRPDEFQNFDNRPVYREPEGNGYYGGPRRGPDRGPMDRMMDRGSPRYDKRPPGGDRPDFRPRYPANDPGEYYPRDGRRRDYPSPGRGLDVPNEPRGYPPEDYPPFMAPKGFGQNDPRAPPRRRSPEPRYNYRASEKPFYPPRDGWYRGPSPNRW
ncbi:hypothetical protein EG68_11265 [Paragonimus skrjabini miyazakii]|uniref:Uncharacterized protein n=1 Tax=Paragonimus skrjabini miyazakii TaxID=59628 RepID=A0A8S9Y9I2_9TREM|nr:hypothetical protein EG68_11265 [Paragonimus skrjabini miyazakii]